MKDTIARYFIDNQNAKPIYAVVRMDEPTGPLIGHKPGDVIDWSISRRYALDKVAAQWSPSSYRVLRIEAVKPR